MKRRDRPTYPHERAASNRFARERARRQRFGAPAFRRRYLPRVYLPDNL